MWPTIPETSPERFTWQQPARLKTAAESAVREQLERIVAHRTFKKSGRGIRLLRHLVNKAPENQIESIEERVFRIEVFGREANYNTSSDPIVRTTATEIRKHLWTQATGSWRR
jgi:hypothetical protein